MLILTRKTGERILIGKDIVLTVTRIGNSQVRLGIDAPSHVNIVRSELEDDDGTDNVEGEAA